MLVARRPLKRLEIESGIVLDDRVSRISAATRPRGDVLSSCYPILDVEDGPCGNVNFCHFTALESVLRPNVAPDLLCRLAKDRPQVSADTLQFSSIVVPACPAYRVTSLRAVPDIQS